MSVCVSLGSWYQILPWKVDSGPTFGKHWSKASANLWALPEGPTRNASHVLRCFSRQPCEPRRDPMVPPMPGSRRGRMWAPGSWWQILTFHTAVWQWCAGGQRHTCEAQTLRSLAQAQKWADHSCRLSKMNPVGWVGSHTVFSRCP